MDEELKPQPGSPPQPKKLFLSWELPVLSFQVSHLQGSSGPQWFTCRLQPKASCAGGMGEVLGKAQRHSGQYRSQLGSEINTRMLGI
jgi:hypothetical protein